MLTLVWFKRDLRLDDHEPLHRALAAGAVLPVYIIEPDYWRQPDTSTRQWQLTAQAVQQLDAALRKLGQPLLVRRGPATQVIRQLLQQFPIQQVCSHQETGNLWTYQRDEAVGRLLQECGIVWQQCRQHAVFRRLSSRDLWFSQADAFLRSPCLPAPDHLPFVWPEPPPPDSIWQLPPRHELAPLAAQQLVFYQQPLQLLQSFLHTRSRQYRTHISLPAKAETSCSRLSVPLSLGQLSLRRLQQDCYQLSKHSRGQHQLGLQAFFSRLRWHCHFMQKLEDEPALEFFPMQPLYRGLRNEHHPAYWQAWSTGFTGYPLIDAAMRCLRSTGWLHFRGRAMLTAFASYQLWLDWRSVALHLARCFNDYEPGIHYPQIQMQAGTTSINPNRMYNPLKQSQQKDPRGDFIRRWCPELAALPDNWLHQPWLLTHNLQLQYHCVLERDYPLPVVDLVTATRLARQRISAWHQQHPNTEWQQSRTQVMTRHASRKRPQPKAKAVNRAQLDFDW
jgi:deoxyribodipyrimidine photo-lyase